ncbi:SDR family oxidoreductase [Streptomyces sp. NBC_00249]|uniref:beta-ketoacyl synthase N-terminal-like domain-containing protein n=1 Tax=Streptomyces sp. NBC_00249 TaxID=2975690 RepID=UPI00224FAB1E|nr:beta-ketoacyl synthase N-terminal-like domain-containing protein [Streptomyces sp. NBC_00249]MCX5195235.1 SDR family oxidoreductase [Streptomyces sp. NBC_00249]
MSGPADDLIAVVGAGCRFPDAWNPQEYWHNLTEGRVSIRGLDPARLLAAGLTREALDDEAYVARAAGIPGAGDFAAEFFGYSPAEAAATDPQQRIFLEACWQALESAGHAPRGAALVTGVFAGGSPSTYMAALQASRALAGGVMAAVDDVALHLGGLGDFLPSRVAYKLGLRGPSIGVQTACSSSLTAVHYAAQSLRAGECDLALAGGASVNEPMLGYRHHAGGLQSRDGYCRPFDARSTGTSFSSGVGVVALRRLADAQRDGDPVLAVLHGTAVGNDGSARSGFTAPSPAGLAQVVARALDTAGVRGDQLRYVEAHGSGTPLGDQIELRGLTAGLRAAAGPGTGAPTGYCGLGSVKANIGHAGPAAGIAGLLAAVAVARTGLLPPHPMFERPRNPGVLADSPFTISGSPTRTTDAPYVLVNSMGLGGTNATAVLGPPPEPTRAPAPARETVRLLLSAHDPDGLTEVAGQLADALTGPDAPALADTAHTLRVGRTAQAHRRVVTAPGTDPLAAARALRDGAAADPAPPAKPLRKVVLVPPREGGAEALVARLAAALKGRAETAPGPGQPPREDRFTILLGHGESAAARHALPLDAAGNATDEAVEAALAAAWARGADVDWEAALPAPGGHRVALPTYPFARGTYWALDTLPPLAAAPAAAPVPSSPQEEAAPAAGDGDPVESELLTIWRSVLGHPGLGPDGAFGLYDGDSLAALRIEAAVQRAFGVTVNVYRAGGAQATVRTMATVVRGLTAAGPGPADGAPTEAELVDADLGLDLGEPGPRTDAPPEAGDTLLTGTGALLDTFVLHELLRATTGLVHCVVPAADEAEARELLRARAAACDLPEPDPARLRPLPHPGPGPYEGYDARLAARVTRVVHSAAPAGLPPGPYGQLREDTVLPFAALLGWMRGHGIEDLTLLSTLNACGPGSGSGLGADARIEETREQPLTPGMDGPAVAAWVGERLAERAEQQGMRVRVFRTGLLLGATGSGACDPDHPLWRLLAGALATGTRPDEEDDRPLPATAVDLAARAVVELALSPGSEGRAYHLVAEEPVTARHLFELLDAAGRPTEPVPQRRWQREVALRALARENEALDPLAPRALDRHTLGAAAVEAQAWQPWLLRGGHDPSPTGRALLGSLGYAAARRAAYAELLTPRSAA